MCTAVTCNDHIQVTVANVTQPKWLYLGCKYLQHAYVSKCLQEKASLCKSVKVGISQIVQPLDTGSFSVLFFQ